MNDIHVINPANKGSGVTRRGKIFKLVNANTWAIDKVLTMQFGTLDDLWSLHFVDTTKGFICGSNGTIYRLDIVRTTDVKESGVASSFALHQNYPNPFNPSTSIGFRVASSGLVTLKVYDILGREVATLVNENLSAGSYEAKFDASNLSSGMYIYRLSSHGQSLSRKLLITK